MAIAPRLLAVVAAVALVVVAVVARQRWDDRSDPVVAGGDRPTLVCLTELAPVCAALAEAQDITVRVEDAATTLATLARADVDPAAAGADGWLTFAPQAAMAADARQRAALRPVLATPSPTLAWAALTMAAWRDRSAVLAPACGGEITWRCVGEHAGAPWATLGGSAAWGPVKPGLPDPDRSAAGLLVLAQATSSYFGRTSYAANDFTEPGFRAWLAHLAAGVPSSPRPPRTPLDEMLSLGPSTFDLAGALEAPAVGAVGRSRVSGDLTILYPAPMAVAEVVLAPVLGTSRTEDLSAALTSPAAGTAFSTAGWQVPTGGTPPADDGLPVPGVLAALRSQWEQVSR